MKVILNKVWFIHLSKNYIQILFRVLFKNCDIYCCKHKKYFCITLLSCLSCPNLATTFFRLNGQCLAGKENFGSRCCLHCLFSSFLPPIFCLLKWSYYTTMYTILEGGLRLIWGKVYIRLAFWDNTQEFSKQHLIKRQESFQYFRHYLKFLEI